MEPFWLLGFLLVLFGLGVLARHIGVLTERRTEWLTATAFYIALPALILHSMDDQGLHELVPESARTWSARPVVSPD